MTDLSTASPHEFSNLVDLLRHRALHQPDKTAYIFLNDGEFQEISLTYQELDQQARSIAISLQSLGAAGQRALLLYPPGLEYIAAFFGCLYAGVAAVPVYPPHPARPERTLPRLMGIIKNARPSVSLIPRSVQVIVDSGFSKVPGLEKMQWIVTTDNVDDDVASDWQEPCVNADTIAFLQYTSGSTGNPKGVMVSHGNLLHNEQMIQDAFGHTEQSVIAGWLPLYHDMGLIGNVLQPLYLGIPCILMSPTAFLQKPVRWLQAISRYRATTSGGPNFSYDLCALKIRPEQRADLDLSSWKIAFNGSEPVREDTMERFSAAFESCGFRKEAFYPCYGLAEATLIVSGGSKNELPIFRNVDEDALRQHRVVPVSTLPEESGKEGRTLTGCGKKLEGQEIVIADPETLRQCQPYEVGEIWISGRSVAQGYWQKHEDTEETFQAHLSGTGEGPFLRTGDLGFFLNEELFITGRHKDLIIIRGRNHYPQDIERTVESSYPRLRPGASAAFSVETDGEEQVVVVAEVERRYGERRKGRDREKYGKKDRDMERRLAQRRQVQVLPEHIPDDQSPLDAEKATESIRRAVSEQHELQVHAVLLLKVGSIPKTSSGKIQRHACRNGFLNNTLAVVGSSIQKRPKYISDKSGQGKFMDEPAVPDLSDVTPEKRRQLLASYLHKLVTVVLKTDPSLVNPLQALTSLGLDSLMAIELQHRLETDLGLTWPMTRFLEGPSILQLADEAVEKLETENWKLKTGNWGEEPVGAISDPLYSVLSHNQKSLWFMYRLAPESPAYNVFFAVRIGPDVDISALRRAFQMLIFRHPSLRTIYTLRDGEPVQQIPDDSQVWFEETDASTWSEDELNARLTEEAHRPFDLENGPLLRVNIFSRLTGGYIFLLNIHHIATDMWSFSVMLDDLGHEIGGTPLTPRPSTLTYADYVRWQAEMLAGPEGDRLWNYWQKQLGGELPVLNLPTDHPRPSVQTYDGTRYSFSLGEELTRKIKVLARDSGATLYMTLMAVFQVLLYRYTDQKDVLVGTPAAGRSRPEFKGIVGYFVNPIVIRSDLGGSPTFSEFLGKVRQTVLDALTHQDYPFQLLVEKLQPERDASRSPVFQVMFGLEKPYRIEASAPFVMKEAGYRMNLGGLDMESLTLKQQFSQFDLMLIMVETDKELLASLEYNTDLFEVSTIARMAGHFRILLEGIADDPDQSVSKLPLLTEAERHQLLVEWNDTRAEYPRDKCLHELFEEQAEQTPNAAAVVFEDEQLSYRELNVRANQLAHRLLALKIRPDMLVGVCMDRSLEMVVGLMGILKAGGAYVPLDPAYPKERLAFMLEDAGVSVLLTQDKLTPELPSHKAYMLCLDTEWNTISQESEECPVSRVRPENLAYVIYTSGSTGKPKGVAVRHYSVLNLLAALDQAIYISHRNSQFRVSLNGPLPFDTSVKQIIQLLQGHIIDIIPESLRIDGDGLLSYLRRRQIDVFDCTPSQLTLLISAGLLSDSERVPKIILVGGESIDEFTWVRLKQAENITFYNVYGPTECTVDSAICDLRTAPDKPVIGRPVVNTEIYILDSHLQPAPVGISGELHIGGAGLARGYLSDPGMTDEKFISNPFSAELGSRLYKTGDKARYLEDGNIEFLGRIDDQVKIRGFRIELKEIGTLLKDHSDVRDAFIIMTEDVPDNKHLAAYIVPESKRSPIIEGRQRYKLPNNLAVAHLNKNETDFIYREMFEVQAYLKHGITINDGDCIFDVGANIGLFTLFAHLKGKDVRVYGFEPSPFAFELLRLNTSLYGVHAKLFDCGLSDRKQMADFTFYPGFSILSGLYADENEEKEVVRSFILRQHQEGLYSDRISDESLEDILSEKFKSEIFAVQLRTISDIIDENNIERIDLLKINVEKSELDVIAGIGEKNWKKIRQIAMEVHDIDGRLDQVKDILEQHGYRIGIEKDWSLEATSETNYYIYAVRELGNHELSDTRDQPASMSLSDPFLTAGELRNFIEQKLPDYMVPSTFIMLESLPLTPNGKVDRQALPDPEAFRPELGAAYEMPKTEAEQRIAEIWQESLRLEKVGIYDNFFDLGGNSLLMIRAHGKLKEKFNTDITIADLFRYPTIAALAQYLSQEADSEQPAFQQVHDRAEKQKKATKRMKQLRKKH